ncbi:MAG: bifunctional 3-deoxy-7-phosphoheptulonate synthase/chorismate mutase [Candidatus Kapaibacterium sp.]
MDEIINLRHEVDKIDREFIKLLIERKEISDKIIKFKRKMNISVYDKRRELEIITALKTEFQELINPQLIENILKEVLFYSKSDNNRLSKSISNRLMDALEDKPILIAGPCSVESEFQLDEIAESLAKGGFRFLRGGAFKPRTSPYSFQGLEGEGVKILKRIADKHKLFVVTEFTDSNQLDEYYDFADIIQIGSRNMFSYGFLKQVGKKTSKDKKPILLKRSFNATINEFLLAAEYLISEGNENILLCLRGIRTFEQIDSMMRNTPDLGAILELKELTDMKVIFDPSHASGDSKYVLSLSKAALQLGADGLLIETHPNPYEAVSDGKQSIQPIELMRLIDFVNRLV